MHMIRRTTVELDYELLERAKAALRCATARETIHEALRRSIDQTEDEKARMKRRRAEYFARMPELLDLEVLRSRRAWR